MFLLPFKRLRYNLHIPFRPLICACLLTGCQSIESEMYNIHGNVYDVAMFQFHGNNLAVGVDAQPAAVYGNGAVLPPPALALNDEAGPVEPAGPTQAAVPVDVELNQIQREAQATLKDMFPLVCPDWIAIQVQQRDVETIADFIMTNEGDAQKVPKIVKKRRRLSQPELDKAGPSDEPVYRRGRPDFDPSTRDHFLSTPNPVFNSKWHRMKDMGRLQHTAMVDALFQALRDSVPAPACWPTTVFFETVYPMIRVGFIRELVNYSSHGRMSMFAVLVILDLLLIGEEERLHREPVFMAFIYDRGHYKTSRQNVQRPHTKYVNNTHLALLAQGRRNPFADIAGHVAAAATKVWEEVTALMKKDHLDLPKFTCEVCFDDQLLLSSIECHSDDIGAVTHHFCFDCVQGQAKACCEEGRVAGAGMGIPCLEVGCKGYITPAALGAAGVEKQVIGQLEKRLEQEALAMAGLPVERCKYCHFGVVMEDSPEENKVFSCSNCTAEFCRLCKRDWEYHVGRPCDEFCNAVDEARKKLENELTAAMIHTCPKCQLSFEKKIGCNKMTCRCGVTMCYVCRATNIDYTHFCEHRNGGDVSTCPMKCNKPCLVSQNVERSLEQRRKELLERARQNPELDEDVVNGLNL